MNYHLSLLQPKFPCIVNLELARKSVKSVGTSKKLVGTYFFEPIPSSLFKEIWVAKVTNDSLLYIFLNYLVTFYFMLCLNLSVVTVVKVPLCVVP